MSKGDLGMALGVILVILGLAGTSYLFPIDYYASTYVEEEINLSEVCTDLHNTNIYDKPEQGTYVYCITENYERKNVYGYDIETWLKYKYNKSLYKQFWKYCRYHELTCNYNFKTAEYYD